MSCQHCSWISGHSDECPISIADTAASYEAGRTEAFLMQHIDVLIEVTTRQSDHISGILNVIRGLHERISELESKSKDRPYCRQPDKS